MSIKEENMELDFINKKSNERNANAWADEAALEYIKVKNRKDATKKLWVAVLAVLIAMVGCAALEAINWISTTFYVVLLAVAGSVGMFKAGYFWCQIKN